MWLKTGVMMLKIQLCFRLINYILNIFKFIQKNLIVIIFHNIAVFTVFPNLPKEDESILEENRNTRIHWQFLMICSIIRK